MIFQKKSFLRLIIEKKMSLSYHDLSWLSYNLTSSRKEDLFQSNITWTFYISYKEENKIMKSKENQNLIKNQKEIKKFLFESEELNFNFWNWKIINEIESFELSSLFGKMHEILSNDVLGYFRGKADLKKKIFRK